MPAIREFLQASANLENQIRTIAEKKHEVIRIAAYASIAMHWMPEILYRFRRMCPEANVDLRMVDHALEPFELLESGQTDVIFASRQSYSCCDWVPLYNERMYAILPRDYPLKGRSAFSIYRLDDRDRMALLWLGFCGLYLICGTISSAFGFRYFPSIRCASLNVVTLSFHLVYLMLCATPIFLNALEDRKWKAIVSDM